MYRNIWLKKNGFEVVSKWAYYEVTPKKVIRKIDHMRMRRRMNVKIASLKDIDEIWSYLINSKVYRLSGRRYVSAWRWYCLDHTSLERFIEEKRLVITYVSLIAGVVIINKNGYWNRNNILQVCYLDSPSEIALQNLIYFIVLCYMIPNKKPPYRSKRFNRLEILAYHTKRLSCVMKKFSIEESEQFLLYTRNI